MQREAAKELCLEQGGGELGGFTWLWCGGSGGRKCCRCLEAVGWGSPSPGLGQ